MANQRYEIHIKGHLSRDWSDWLEGMRLHCLESGEMILSGVLVDQAALMGVLNKLNRLNLTILSVYETGALGDGSSRENARNQNEGMGGLR